MADIPVSVIVPVYNAEKYLHRCIDSILGQTALKNPAVSNFELVLVDDCSTDSSLAICEQYAQKDKRVKVIHKNKNGGTADARHTGLEASAGEYVLHLDSDDWIEPDLIEETYKMALDNDSDMVIFDYFSEDRGGG
jgi:glycosyltransferase involved in cell wall biosynthesis